MIIFYFKEVWISNSLLSKIISIMVGYMDLAERVVNGSDILLIVVDARDVRKSISKELEEMIRTREKKFLYVINKCDLLTKEEQSKLRLNNSVEVSAKRHWGTMRLLRKIKEMSRGEDAIIGVVGYSNTGKSTLINALKGKHCASTSPRSGYTKHIQKLKIDDGLYLLDTPGVFLDSPDADLAYVIIGAKDPERLKEPEKIAVQFILEMKGSVEKHYSVARHRDPYKTIDEIALKKKFLKKGGLPDSTRASRQIIRDWQGRKGDW